MPVYPGALRIADYLGVGTGKDGGVGGGFNVLAQRLDKCCWRVVDGLERGLDAQNFLLGPHSPMILRSVYVLVTLPLGKHWAIDRSADPKGKLQLTIF